jgi:4-hydroxybenzoate polyprenyltransferase
MHGGQTPVPGHNALGMRLRGVVRLLRPKQWSKNVLVFAALLFTANFAEPSLVLPALMAFAAMCLASSGTYVLNDLADLGRDRAHPIKRRRPLASGEVPTVLAYLLAPVLVLSGLLVAASINVASLIVVLAYLLLQALYNGALKRLPIADVFTIAFGFILRAALGAASIEVGISSWLLLCTGALALLVGFGKRRSEFISQGDLRGETRESLGGYSRSALDALVIVSACVSALCYGIYSVESPTALRYPALILTAPFVFYGICRYLLLVFGTDEGGEPETLLLRDPHIVGSVVLFILAALIAMSGVQLPILEGGTLR